MSLATTGRAVGLSVLRTVADPTRHVARRARPLPMAWLPVLVVVFAFLFPGNFVLPGPLRSNGSPARIISFVCLGLAILTFLAAARRRSDDEPPRWSLVGGAIVLYVGAAFWTYGVATMQPLDAVESAGALRSLMTVLGVTGLAVYVWMVVRERADADRILGWIVAGATFSVVVALASRVGIIPSWTSLVRGGVLVENTATLRELSRLDMVRSRGTGEHPLEFSLATTAALPLALHYARFATTGARRAASVLASILLLVGVPLAVSRTAVLGLAIGAIVAISIWPALAKFGALVVAGLAITGVFVLFPDVVRSLLDIFVLAGEDNSVTGRVEDYTLVEQMFRENPVLGMGMGVYRPETGGVFLDNSWLGTIIGAGAVGVVILAILFLVPAGVAWDRSLLAPDAASRSLFRSLLAVLAVILMGSITSDLTSFQQPVVVFMAALGVLASRAVPRGVNPA